MDIAFDPTRDVINRAKHGVPLAFGGRIFADAGMLRIPSPRLEDDEVRWKSWGWSTIVCGLPYSSSVPARRDSSR